MTITRPALIASLVALAAAAPASADIFAVDNADDADLSTCSAAANDCTLRGVLNKANASPDPDTIMLPGLRIAVASPLPIIDSALTIQGVGARASIVDGTGRVGTLFRSSFGSDTTLEDLQVTGAQRTPHQGDAAVSKVGLLERVAIVDNQATGFLSGNATISDTLIARNTGEGAGGVIASAGGTTITNSTIADNTAVPGSGAPLTGPLVFSGGVINAGVLLEIDHSTITGNGIAPGAELLTGTNLGSIGQLDPSTVVRSSLIGGSAGPECGGPIDSNGHNVVSDASCHFAGAGDRVGADPLLAPLADNGGPTDTVALLRGSPAIDAGDNCPAADQRGQSRAQGAACDAGAFESPFTAPVPTAAPPAAGDTRAPRLSVAGVGRRVRRKALRAGLRVRVGADEPVAAEVELLVAPSRVTLARTPDLALVRLSLPRQAGTRTVRLKPRRRLSGTRPIPAQLRIVAFDGSGNRTAKTIRFTIR